MPSPDPRMPDPDSIPGREAGDAGTVVDWDEARKFAYDKALRICRRELADDVAQESVLRLFRYNGVIRDWRALLSTIVFKTSLTALKRQKSTQARVAVDSVQTEHATASEPTPIDCLMVKLLVLELDQRFGRGTRAIVDFRKQRFSWEEIARFVGLTDRTCRDRYQKALTWISNQLITCTSKESTHD